MALEIVGVSSGYFKATPVIRSIDLELGELPVGVIGRNGAGKSCLAQTVSGSLPVHTGSIQLDGRDITQLSARDRMLAGISLVPEGRMVFGQLSVHENLVAAAFAARRPNSEIAALSEFFPILGRKAGDAAASLSGGEQQMLSIARALVQRPRVLVLDEPTLGLSPTAIENLISTLEKVRTELGVSMLIMEQNADLLTDLCPEVLLLTEGLVERRLQMSSASDRAQLFSSYLGI